MDNPQTEKTIPDRTNAGNGIRKTNTTANEYARFLLSLDKIFEMSELCNNSACFFVEIKGTSDICVTFVV